MWRESNRRIRLDPFLPLFVLVQPAVEERTKAKESTPKLSYYFVYHARARKGATKPSIAASEKGFTPDLHTQV